MNVLVVNGREGGRPAENASYYVQKVLAPSTSREAWSGATRPKVINEADLASEDLSQYDCVFLCNVALVTPTEAALLQAYAEAGGGVVFTLGDRVKPENYNAVLYRDGTGVLPAALGNRQGDARDPEPTAKRIHVRDGRFESRRSSLRSAAIRTPGSSGPSRSNISRSKLPPASPARVVLRFDSGDPAILERPVGLGRSILVDDVGRRHVERVARASDLSADYPRDGPLRRRRPLAGTSTAGRRSRCCGPSRRGRLLSPSWCELPTAPSIRSARFRTRKPHRSSTLRRPTAACTKSWLDRPPRSRRLPARRLPARRVPRRVVANCLPSTSTPARATSNRSTKRRSTRRPWPASRTSAAASGRKAPATRATERPTAPVWRRGCLVAIVALLLVEPLLAWSFRHGFVLLCTLAACGLVAPWLPHNAFGGLVLALLLAGGVVAIVLFGRERRSSWHLTATRPAARATGASDTGASLGAGETRHAPREPEPRHAGQGGVNLWVFCAQRIRMRHSRSTHDILPFPRDNDP